MTKAKVMMYNKEGGQLVETPFLIKIAELLGDKERNICLEKGDKFVVVEVPE